MNLVQDMDGVVNHLAFEALGWDADSAPMARVREDILAGRESLDRQERFKAAKAGVQTALEYVIKDAPQVYRLDKSEIADLSLLFEGMGSVGIFHPLIPVSLGNGPEFISTVPPYESLTQDERHILRHALGLDRSPTSYRNRYMINPKDSTRYTIVQTLETRGLLVRADNDGGPHNTYHVTDAGKRLMGVST